MEVQENISSETDILDEIAAKKIREFAPVIAFVAVVVVCGFLGNIVTVAYYGFQVKRNNTTVSICVLAVVDAITCLVTSDEIIELCYAVTFRSLVGCQLMYFLNHTCVVTSGLLLFYIGIDRFRKVCFPFSWQFNIKTSQRCVLCVTIFAISLSVRDFVILDIVRVPIQNGTVRAYYCTHSNDKDLKPVVKAFQMIDAIIALGLVISLIIMYTMMIRKIFVKHKKVTNTRLELEGESTFSSFRTTENTNLYFEPTSQEKPSGGGQCATDISNSVSLASLATDCDISHINIPPRDQLVNSDIISCGNQRLMNEKISKTTNWRMHARPSHYKRAHNSVSMSSRVERQITLMMGAISLGFILSFVPYFVVNLALKLTSGTNESELNVGIQVALRSYLLNSAINPYIICLFNSGYRRFVMQNISKYCRCAKDDEFI